MSLKWTDLDDISIGSIGSKKLVTLMRLYHEKEDEEEWALEIADNPVVVYHAEENYPSREDAKAAAERYLLPFMTKLKAKYRNKPPKPSPLDTL